MKIIPPEVGERARWHVVMGPNGCHLSRFSVNKRGYAQIAWREPGQRRLWTAPAHRASWTAVHGAIPDGLTVDHECRTPRCVRVDHLRLLSRSENSRRGRQDFPLGQSCAAGHPASARRPASPGRSGTRCSMCQAEQLQAWRAANPEKYRAQLDRQHARIRALRRAQT